MLNPWEIICQKSVKWRKETSNLRYFLKDPDLRVCLSDRMVAVVCKGWWCPLCRLCPEECKMLPKPCKVLCQCNRSEWIFPNLPQDKLCLVRIKEEDCLIPLNNPTIQRLLILSYRHFKNWWQIKKKITRIQVEVKVGHNNLGLEVEVGIGEVVGRKKKKAEPVPIPDRPLAVKVEIVPRRRKKRVESDDHNNYYSFYVVFESLFVSFR